MARKADIKQAEPLAWDRFEGKTPKDALQAIYLHAMAFSAKCRTWYWTSITKKRLISMVARLAAFTLGAFGVVSPLLAALWPESEMRLASTQVAVASLALAGLAHGADRVFGWSSGWLRYISTVTAMESLTRQFELDWAGYFIAKEREGLPAEVRALFDLAKHFEEELADLQKRETDAWLIEFHSGVAALDDIIKSARESAQKSAAEVRDAQQSRSKAGSPGAIELTATATTQPLPTIAVLLDDGSPEVCTGMTWARVRVEPGAHRMVIRPSHNNVSLPEIVKIVEVQPGATARVTVPM